MGCDGSMESWFPTFRKKVEPLKRLEPAVQRRSVAYRKISILDVSVMTAVHDKTCWVYRNDAVLVFVLTVELYTAMRPGGFRSPV